MVTKEIVNTINQDLSIICTCRYGKQDGYKD